MSARSTRLWGCALLLGACVEPEVPSVEPPVVEDSAPVEPVETDLPELPPELPPIAPEITHTLGAAVRATFTSAALVERAPLQALLDYIRTQRRTRCSELTEEADGVMVYEVECHDDDIDMAGELRWRDTAVSALDEPSAQWARAWLPQICPEVDPSLPLDPPAPALLLLGHYTEVDPDSVPVHLRGAFADVQPTWPGCHAARTAADGYADQEGASPGSWTGSELEVQRLEVGRVRAGGAALFTLEGTLGGVNGPFRTVDVTDGAWLADGVGCGLEPRGVWGLRTDDGAWYDVTFDEVCDGCGVARAPGHADTPACIDALDAAAISALVQAAVP